MTETAKLKKLLFGEDGKSGMLGENNKIVESRIPQGPSSCIVMVSEGKITAL